MRHLTDQSLPLRMLPHSMAMREVESFILSSSASSSSSSPSLVGEVLGCLLISAARAAAVPGSGSLAFPCLSVR